MAAKKSMKESRGRKWSEDELKEFASVLAEDRTEFVTKICISKSCLSWRRREIEFKSLDNLFAFRGLEVHFWRRFNWCPLSSESRA